jgi:regulator of replication initiation timing
MVAGKVRLAMGLQKSPSHSKQETPPKPPLPSPSSAKVPQKAVFSRSFGVYFPRSSAQVQPRPPDVTELLRVVEDLRERESRLKTELLGHKLLKESVAIVPVLENEISTKNAELDRAAKRIESLEIENRRLIMELEELKKKLEEEKEENEKKVKAMEVEISELKKTASDRNRTELILESDELSSSQRFQGLMEVSVKSNLIKNLRKPTKYTDGAVLSFENLKLEGLDSKKEEPETERPRHSRCNSEELAESTLANLRSRPPRVPKPPPTPSSSTSSSSSSCSSNGPCSSPAIPMPPPPPKKSAPPPPPPPPLKGMKVGAAKVRRVPEVVEFYHSLMRRDSRRDSANSDVAPSTTNARDMIGEIENRSAHLLAVSFRLPVLIILLLYFGGPIFTVLTLEYTFCQ